MMKSRLLIGLVLTSLSVSELAGAQRDWEYWPRFSFEAPITDRISYVIKPEWRIRDDMSYQYLFKLEQALSFKINQFLEIAPYYVWQQTRSAGNADRSDLLYLDTTVKIPLEEFFQLRIINRLRYQYNFDKEFTVWRNAARVTKAFRIGKHELAPFLEDEIFYDTRSDKLSENWASIGASLTLNKHTSIGISYLLDTRRSGDDWTHANVLVTSLAVRF